LFVTAYNKELASSWENCSESSALILQAFCRIADIAEPQEI
jgi:hypothetical protein